MIEFRSGDILKDESEALVNTVNCVGVMGRAIANSRPGRQARHDAPRAGARQLTHPIGRPARETQ